MEALRFGVEAAISFGEYLILAGQFAEAKGAGSLLAPFVFRTAS